LVGFELAALVREPPLELRLLGLERTAHHRPRLHQQLYCVYQAAFPQRRSHAAAAVVAVVVVVVAVVVLRAVAAAQ